MGKFPSDQRNLFDNKMFHIVQSIPYSWGKVFLRISSAHLAKYLNALKNCWKTSKAHCTIENFQDPYLSSFLHYCMQKTMEGKNNSTQQTQQFISAFDAKHEWSEHLIKTGYYGKLSKIKTPT